jgi:hypothetical protein
VFAALPYFVALAGFLAFTLAGAFTTLAAWWFAPLRALLAFAWRIWLWGSIGFVAANIALFAILFPFLSGLGISGGSPSHTDWVALSLGVLVVLGPPLASASGVILGAALGCYLAWRRRMIDGAQPSNQRLERP